MQRKLRLGSLLIAWLLTFASQLGGAGGASARPIHKKYDTDGSDIPTVNWKELILIRAEAVGGQGAIDLVNVLRTSDKLPLVTYATAGNAAQIRQMIIEERRRALFLEGRFLMTKIKNPDILWFPRAQGQTPGAGRALGGGVGVRWHDERMAGTSANLRGVES